MHLNRLLTSAAFLFVLTGCKKDTPQAKPVPKSPYAVEDIANRGSSPIFFHPVSKEEQIAERKFETDIVKNMLPKNELEITEECFAVGLTNPASFSISTQRNNASYNCKYDHYANTFTLDFGTRVFGNVQEKLAVTYYPERDLYTVDVAKDPAKAHTQWATHHYYNHHDSDINAAHPTEPLRSLLPTMRVLAAADQVHKRKFGS